MSAFLKPKLWAMSLAFAALAGPALATGPSFSCGGKLTSTERTICKSAVLSDLDRTMARFYYATRDISSSHGRRELRSVQRVWLQWRDTCGGNSACLERRYKQRIIDLVPPERLPPGFGCHSGFVIDTSAMLPESL